MVAFAPFTSHVSPGIVTDDARFRDYTRADTNGARHLNSCDTNNKDFVPFFVHRFKLSFPNKYISCFFCFFCQRVYRWNLRAGVLERYHL